MRTGTELIARVNDRCEKCGEAQTGLVLFTSSFEFVVNRFCATCEPKKLDAASKAFDLKVDSGTYEFLETERGRCIQPRRVPDVSKFKPSWNGIK